MVLSLVVGIALSWSACQPPGGESRQTDIQVAVVDRFYPGDEYYQDARERIRERWLHGFVDLDRDREREPFFHGDIVSLLAADPQITVRPFPMTLGVAPQEEILRQLKEVRKFVFWGEPIKAVVLSWESSTLVSAFEKPLRQEHVDIYKEQVRQWGLEQDSWRLSYEIIRVMEDLAEVGVLVVTIAGNGGSGMVNTYSFADGVVTVGASEQNLQHFIAENVFVTAHAPAIYQPRLVRDNEGNALGYDFDGDLCPDVALTCLSGYSPERTDYPDKPWPLLKGSSFAAPQALKQMLVGTDRACAAAGSGVVSW